jgi:hypothetical protein
VIVCYCHGRRVEPECPPGIAKASPMPHRFPRGIACEIRGRRPTVKPVLPHRQNPDHGSLLEHDFTHQDTPRAAGGIAPGKAAGGLLKPGVQGTVELIQRQVRRNDSSNA